MKFVALALLAASMPAVALAQSGPASGPSEFASSDRSDPPDLESSSAPAGGERLICRRIQTGGPSRMNSRRVCRTAAEWRGAQRD